MVIAAQVLDGEAVYLMGFQEEDLAFFKERITLYGGEIVDAARYSTTVLVHPSKVCPSCTGPRGYMGWCSNACIVFVYRHTAVTHEPRTAPPGLCMPH